MNNLKLLFSSLTVAFGILGLTKAVSNDITMPATIICFAITMFITSKEHKSNECQKSALCFLILGVFLLLVTAYNIITSLFGL